jgi:DNA polymerase-3 subunit alpha
LLSMEKEMTGVYISGHPLDEYKDALDGYHTTQDIMALHNTDENEMMNRLSCLQSVREALPLHWEESLQIKK